MALVENRKPEGVDAEEPAAKRAKVGEDALTKEDQQKIAVLKRMVSLMDLTSLGDKDTEEVITDLIALGQGNELKTLPGAFCIFRQFVKFAKSKCGQTKMATVVNFPLGASDMDTVRKEINESLDAGADEVDIVIAYEEYLKLTAETTPEKSPYVPAACDMVKMAKEMCASKGALLKVIIESGAYEAANRDELIKLAAEDAVNSGADFIKTSTGKVKIGATVKSAEIMLKVIKAKEDEIAAASANGANGSENGTTSKKFCCGFKASGGIRTYDDALPQIKLAEDILGEGFVKPEYFRFGVSGLMTNLVNEYKKIIGEKGEAKKAETSY